MKKLALVTLLFLITSFFPALAKEENKEKEPVDVIRQCLAGTTEPIADRIMVKCVGAKAKACLQNKANETTSAMADCYREEGLIWNALLSENFQGLKKQLTKPQFDALAAYQRDWAKLVQQKCLLKKTFYDGTINKIIAAQCSHSEVARRSIEIYLLRKELPAK